MTGASDHRSLRGDEVRDLIGARCWTPAPGPERVGLELEALPIRTAADRTPAARCRGGVDSSI
jgi:hypothetical protein